MGVCDGEDDGLDAGVDGGEELGLDAAHGEDLAHDGDLVGHRQVVADGKVLEGGDDAGDHGDPGQWAFLVVCGNYHDRSLSLNIGSMIVSLRKSVQAMARVRTKSLLKPRLGLFVFCE